MSHFKASAAFSSSELWFDTMPPSERKSRIRGGHKIEPNRVFKLSSVSRSSSTPSCRERCVRPVSLWFVWIEAESLWNEESEAERENFCCKLSNEMHISRGTSGSFASWRAKREKSQKLEWTFVLIFLKHYVHFDAKTSAGHKMCEKQSRTHTFSDPFMWCQRFLERLLRVLVVQSPRGSGKTPVSPDHKDKALPGCFLPF